MKNSIAFLFSTRLMAVLFVVFAVAMGVATFIENDYGTQTSKALVYNTWWFELIMALFVVNFFGNIFRYRLYKKEKWPVLLFHIAFLLILVGAGVTRYISFEGIMPIKEGETTDLFFSDKIYLTVTIDDDKDQRVVSDDLLLSAWGLDSYTFDTDFRKQHVEFKLTDYVPYAYEKFVEGETGDDYIHFVESSSGSRHDHYIKKGMIENIHGVLVGYEHKENAVVNFESKDGELKMESLFEGTFFRMADKLEGTIEKDTLSSFKYLTLHKIAGMSFVVPKPPLKGGMKVVSGDRLEHPEDLLTFEATTKGEKKTFQVTGGKFANNAPEQFTLGGLNFRVTYGSKQMKLPFQIKLNDFQLEKYPGSESAMSYASEVTVIDAKEIFDFRVFMNNILNYKGYKFFQSSYEINEEYEETRLSVNHDYWGSLITYIGYFALYTGLILILIVKNTRFSSLRHQLRKLRKKKGLAVFIAFLFLSVNSFSQEKHQEHGKEISAEQIDSLLIESAVDKLHAEQFSALVIQDAGGRMKPVHTFASQLLRKVSKGDTYHGLDANQVFLSIIENPRLWFQVPIVYLKRGDDKLRIVLGIDTSRKYAKLIDFIDENGRYKIKSIVEEAQKTSIKSQFQKDVINADKRVGLLYSAIGGAVLRIFPIPNDDNNTWVSQPELSIANFTGIDSVFVKQILPVYIQTLQKAKKLGDYTEASEILNGVKNFQKKYGEKVYPSDDKIKMEIAYNKYDVFKKLFEYYMYSGALLFFLVIFQIFRSNKIVDILVKVTVVIIIVFFILHTGGLAARWYVSGHVPWSNTYEGMTFVAWATVLFGLLFGRKSTLTIAATAFLSAMILMIAHWNWLDPEIANLVPVLNSYWNMIHVSIIVGSYGPLALSLILGLIGLLLMIFTNSKNKKKLNLTLKELTIVNEMSMTVGVIMLTIGNFLGGMWANESWGRYWGWDPKETWALISIMVYAFVLHTRLVPGLRGRYLFTLLSVVAFASIAMTYFGVNFYLSGLHSYASGDKIVTPGFIYYSIGIVSILGILAYIQNKKHYKK